MLENFKFAMGNDWWFHTKGIPGSPVVVKTNGSKLGFVVDYTNYSLVIDSDIAGLAQVEDDKMR